ncbi:C-4 methylsterol oxidase [Kockovaella imperatae]|uniref:C-4 methylsterol oxidase n=1 Tax=Kockovaella imperatae TaxID=4999 RepID=A0A1Y1UEQ7_9TREE|nr:C-4 methylsterol oxidase [Kockovaella imperatae]ORX35986.1 C-4 methylsterol oxidase [Kockovaella imperatae]
MASSTVMKAVDQFFPYLAPHLQIMNSTTAQNTLYGAVDWSQTSWLERKWAAYYVWIANPLIATGLLSFVWHEIIYFGRAFPFWVMDQIPYFNQWKIQETKLPSHAEYMHCLKTVLAIHFLIELPLIFAFHPICEYFGMATYEIPFSPVWKMAAQIAFFFVFEDTFHYWAHRWLHTPFMYKRVHKMHHKYQVPFGLAAEYAHPIETLILSQGTISGPFVYCLFAPKHSLHILTVYVWIALRLAQAIDAHSGFDFPWSLRQFMPFWAGADYHDSHHAVFKGNYATSFRWWDQMMGTDRWYKAQRASEAEKKLKAQQSKSQ